MKDTKSIRVGIVCGSQRKPRVGDQVTDFVHRIIETHPTNGLSLSFDRIDVATLALPLFDEPGIPSAITNRPDGYANQHTRRWSAWVSALDAFVFVTPQYNWGIPAGLKNAIDYLFHEWHGKPAMIVTYGGHGGSKCAAQMQTVLAGGLGMRVDDCMVINMSFPDKETLYKATRGEYIGLADDGGGKVWKVESQAISEGWEQTMRILVGGVPETSIN